MDIVVAPDQKMSLARRLRASSVGLVSLVSGLPPILYLAANSGACLLFVDSASRRRAAKYDPARVGIGSCWTNSEVADIMVASLMASRLSLMVAPEAAKRYLISAPTGRLRSPFQP